MSSASPGSSRESFTTRSCRGVSSSRIIGVGEMAELIRGFDWGKNSLGPIETWSDTLVTTVNLLLASRHPMFLWWGADLIQFYNDGYGQVFAPTNTPPPSASAGRSVGRKYGP